MSDEGSVPKGDSPMAAMGMTKTLLLRWGDFPATGEKTSPVGRAVSAKNTEAWIRSPNGEITRLELAQEADKLALKCPPESADGAERPNGIYLAGVHADAGVLDFDADGKAERVHFYASALVSHYVRNGADGKNPDVSFGASEKLLLEIAPVVPHGSQGRYAAANQTATEENRLRVFYKGRPLARARVSVLSDSGWRNHATTDAEGVFSVVPVGKKSDSSRRAATAKCLYVVTHKETTPGKHGGAEYAAEYHCASLMMNVRTPRPEWTSKAEGFTVVAVAGVGLLVLAGVFAVYRRQRRGRQVMVAFDRYRIREE